MPKYYPGWIVRLYTDYDIEDSIFEKLCNLACRHSNLDICHVKDLPGTPFSDASKFFPMNWRFFPTMDPQVYLLLIMSWLAQNANQHYLKDDTLWKKELYA